MKKTQELSKLFSVVSENFINNMNLHFRRSLGKPFISFCACMLSYFNRVTALWRHALWSARLLCHGITEQDTGWLLGFPPGGSSCLGIELASPSVSCMAGGFFTTSASQEALISLCAVLSLSVVSHYMLVKSLKQ